MRSRSCPCSEQESRPATNKINNLRLHRATQFSGCDQNVPTFSSEAHSGHSTALQRALFQGTIDGASVHPREVMKEALKQNAASVVHPHPHPHPSGVAEPSQADEIVTRRLADALALVDIRVLDHIIVAGGETLSFAESGRL